MFGNPNGSSLTGMVDFSFVLWRVRTLHAGLLPTVLVPARRGHHYRYLLFSDGCFRCMLFQNNPVVAFVTSSPASHGQELHVRHRKFSVAGSLSPIHPGIISAQDIYKNTRADLLFRTDDST